MQEEIQELKQKKDYLMQEFLRQSLELHKQTLEIKDKYDIRTLACKEALTDSDFQLLCKNFDCACAILLVLEQKDLSVSDNKKLFRIIEHLMEEESKLSLI